MRNLVAVLIVVITSACGGPKKPAQTSIVPEGSDTPESCCCKSNPFTSEDGKPVYEMAGRMECSSKHGECVDEVQCNKSPVVSPQ